MFLQLGVVVFGSGYVLVAFLGNALVTPGYISQQELLDAIAIGQLTPGPRLHDGHLHRLSAGGHPRRGGRDRGHLPARLRARRRHAPLPAAVACQRDDLGGHRRPERGRGRAHRRVHRVPGARRPLPGRQLRCPCRSARSGCPRGAVRRSRSGRSRCCSAGPSSACWPGRCWPDPRRGWPDRLRQGATVVPSRPTPTQTASSQSATALASMAAPRSGRAVPPRPARRPPRPSGRPLPGRGARREPARSGQRRPGRPVRRSSPPGR